jgi:hypothetical protein
MLEQTATIFRGSHLRMRFAVLPRPRIGLAFPGSPAERSTTTAAAPAPLSGTKTGHFAIGYVRRSEFTRPPLSQVKEEKHDADCCRRSCRIGAAWRAWRQVERRGSIGRREIGTALEHVDQCDVVH